MGFKNFRAAAIGAVIAGILTASVSMAQTFSIFQENASEAYLGISMTDVTAATLPKYKLSSEKGVIVSSVKKGSPAEAAALKEDDVILEYGGVAVWSSYQLARLVRETPVGRTVDLGIIRDGKSMNLRATLETRDRSLAEERQGMLRPEQFRSGPYGYRFGIPEDWQERNADPMAGKPRLGVTLQSMTDQMAEFLGVPGKKGALITSVSPGSVSEGKLKSGDVVVGTDKEDIDGPEDLTRLIRDASGQIALKIIRDKKPMTVVIDLPSGENQKGYKL